MASSSPAVVVSVWRQGRLVLEKPEAIKRRLRERYARVPAERQLVDEFLTERRLEAHQEVA